MPLTNDDNPVTKPKAAKAEPKPEAAAEPTPEPARLARASTSSDAAVHRLLAERQVAVRNNDPNAVAAVDRELAALGYAV